MIWSGDKYSEDLAWSLDDFSYTFRSSDKLAIEKIIYRLEMIPYRTVQPSN